MKFYLTVIVVLIATACLSQSNKYSVFGFPVFYYTPETGYGGGVAGAYSFYLNPSDSISPPSLLQAGFSYTQNEQLTFYAPLQLFWDNRNWMAGVELGVYNYRLLYFGDNQTQRDHDEPYDAEEVKIRTNLQRRVFHSWYAGVRFWYDHASIQFPNDVENERRQIQRYYSPGVLITHDRRDNVYYPTCGNMVELVSQVNVGTSDFMRYRFDLRTYTPISNSLIWANQVFADFVDGNSPFYLMPQLGGSKRFRGFYEGKLRANTAMMFQTEMRKTVYRRWGVAVFSSIGQTEDWDDVFGADIKIAYGGGIRFMADRKKKLNMRLDVGVGDQKPLFYLAIGEAF